MEKKKLGAFAKTKPKYIAKILKFCYFFAPNPKEVNNFQIHKFISIITIIIIKYSTKEYSHSTAKAFNIHSIISV